MQLGCCPKSEGKRVPKLNGERPVTERRNLGSQRSSRPEDQKFEEEYKQKVS